VSDCFGRTEHSEDHVDLPPIHTGYADATTRSLPPLNPQIRRPTEPEEAVAIDVIAIDYWSASDRDSHVRDAFVSELTVCLADCGVRTHAERSLDVGDVRQRYWLYGSFVSSREGFLHITVELLDPNCGTAVLNITHQDRRELVFNLARTISDHIVTSLNHSALLA